MQRTTRSFFATLAVAFLASTGQVQAQHADHGPVFDGAWDVSFSSQMGEMTLRFDLEADGHAISGIAASPAGEAVVEGMQDGDDLAFTVFIDQPDHQVELVFSGTLEGETAEGTVDIMDEAYGWTAKRADG